MGVVFALRVAEAAVAHDHLNSINFVELQQLNAAAVVAIVDAVVVVVDSKSNSFAMAVFETPLYSLLCYPVVLIDLDMSTLDSL